MIAATAHWTASARALENQHAEPLFSDPWAAALAGEQGAAWLAQRTPESLIPIIIRTRYFDDFLQRIVHQSGIRQVVLLAAGLDTRAFRLNWPEGTRLFEIDQAEVIDYKERILKSLGAQHTCDRRVIQADLNTPWQEAILAHGFNPGQTACWLIEGLLFYLSNEAIVQLIEAVTNLSAAGSWLGFDAINQAVLTSPFTKAWIEMQAQLGAPWIGSLDDPKGVLASLGWKASLTQAGQPDANFDRWVLPVIPTEMPTMPHNWFVTAKKER
jgi:methyltransferase (TIGR00027 family)